jgi:hypothetical protein
MAFKQSDIDFFKKYNWVFTDPKDGWSKFYETFAASNQYWLHDDNKFGDATFEVKKQNFVGTWELTSSDFILKFDDGTTKSFTNAQIEELQNERSKKSNKKKDDEKDKKQVSTKEVDKTINMSDFLKTLPKNTVKKYEFDCDKTWDDSENFFYRDFQSAHLEDAAKDFIKYYLSFDPNYFTGSKSNLCGYNRKGELINDDLENYNNNVIRTLSLKRDDLSPEFRDKNNYEVWKIKNMEKIKTWLKDDLNESVLKKLSEKKLQKSIQEKLNNKLKKSLVERETIKRNLLKINENFGKRRYKNLIEGLLHQGSKLSLSEQDSKDFFVKTFDHMFYGSDDLIKRELLKRIFEVLKVPEQSDMGQNIAQQFEGITNEQLSTMFLDCEIVASKIADAISPTIISELPAGEEDSLMSMVQQQVSDTLTSQKTKETLKFKISHKICPEITSTKDKIMNVSNEMRKNFTDFEF